MTRRRSLRSALVFSSCAAALALASALPAQAASFNTGGEMSENFRTEDPTNWIKVGAPNTWDTPYGQGQYQADHVQLGPDGLQMTVDGKGSGEYRTNPRGKIYGYGVYTARFKPSATKNIMSGSFFTYFDKNNFSPDDPYAPKFGENEVVHDEIDFEFFTDYGRNTTMVQTNYFIHNVGHSEMHDLGFDASQGMHTYSFDWRPDSITWLVDGKQIRKVTGTQAVDIPSWPGMIIANIWPSKDYDNTPSTAVYDSVTFTPNPVPSPPPFPWMDPNDPFGGGVIH